MSLIPSEWEALLARRLGRTVEVRYGRARTAPVQVEDDGKRIRVRLHRFFVGAPPSIREALGSWIRVGRRARRACAELDTWIDDQLARLPARPPAPPPTLVTRGNHHDLAPLARSLLHLEFARDFAGSTPPRIGWGRRGRSRARRALQLGSYEPERHLVRIHPVLDRSEVPEWFLRYVLFHELIHAALACNGAAGEDPDACDHGPAFRARERGYPDLRRARRWQRAHLGRLIRAVRRGVPPLPARGRRQPVQGTLFDL